MGTVDARRLLEGFLARMDAGELPDFDALLREHPAHADELRRLFAEECERLDAGSEPASDAIARLSERRQPFARYSVGAEIGRGGMGTVLEVRDEDLRRDLAMKVTSGSDVGRFLEEAQITGQLDHPGIVPVHELGLDPEGRVYFTMKLVKGRTLAEVLDLARDGRDGWTQAKVLGAVQRVCEAMAYAHEKGVVHRDLKPSNVMIGAFGEVYVMDWGLARVVGAPDRRDLRLRIAEAPGGSALETDRDELRHATPGSPLLTRDGQVVGTPAYMPPEQAAGRVEAIGPHSDVYSVGAMIYHLLAGEPPFAGSGAKEVWLRVCAGPPPPIESVAPRAPPELQAICSKAMQRDGRARYRDMREMAADLAAFLEGRVVRAHETGALAEARKWIRRNRGLAAALAGAVLALVAGLVASLALKRRADEHSFRAEKTAVFLVETLAGVRPSVAMGRDTTMLREMMDAALARIDAGELSAAPESEMRLLHVVGGSYRDIGQYERSAAVLRRAEAHARKLLEPEEILFTTILADLGLALGDLGAHEDAAALARETLEIHRRVRPDDRIRIASSLQNLASCSRGLGALEEAEGRFREAASMLERLAPAHAEQRALCLNNLAVVLEERGNAAEAEDCARRSLEIRKELYSGDHPLVAANLTTLATLRLGRGDLDGAESLHREALSMRRRLYPGDHADLAVSLNDLATVLYHRKDHDEAEKLWRETLGMQRRLLPGDHEHVATTLDNLAAALIAKKEHAAAEPLQLEALEMRRRLFPDGHGDLALSLHNLGVQFRLRGDLERAEGFAREAVEMGEKSLPAGHPRLATIRGGLARVLVLRGKFAEAEALLQDDPAHAKYLAELHEAWEKAEPGAGHAERALEWRQQLEAEPKK